MSILRVELLGRFALCYGDKPVTSVDTHRLQSLLAQLVLKAGVAQSRQHLSFLFWPDSVESQARTNLRQLLHHFRSALPDIDRFLESGSQSLLWRKESEFSLDVMEFESSIAEARAAQKVQDQAKEQSCLEKAVGIYRGDLLPGFYEEWIEEERQRLKAQYEAALNRLLVILEGRRLIPAAIQHGEQLLRLDPLNETSVQHLMRLHALVGDLASTSRVYQQCVAVLQRELGVTPSPTTRRLLEKLMKPEAGPLVESPAEPRPPSPRLSLVGRQTELSRMQEVWNTVIEGQASFVLICGEPGIGKSRLLEEFTSWAASRNASTAYARCYVPEQHLSFAPVTQWLRSQAMLRALPKLLPVQLSELARVLPELLAEHPGLTPPQPFTENWQRRHFLEGMAQAVLNARQPLLLVLDDLQWCDQDTIDWIQFLLHFAPRMKLLIAATVRLDELGHSHPATRMLQQLQRDELVTQIVLQRLNLEQTSTLASEVSRQKLDVSSFAHLYQETEGNPLFVIESVRAGLVTAETSDESSGTNPDARPSRGLLPPKVHAVLSARLAQLSPPAHDLVGVAATIGRAFNFELLARASQHSEHSLAPLLDELWERQVIQCQKGDIYDFTHDKLREVAYAEMGPARQRLSHRSVAEALEAISVPDLDAVSSHLATHFALAGMHARAIPYYHLAAKLSQRVYADHEASQYLKKALDLIKHLPQSSERDRLELELLILSGPSLTVIQGYASSEVGAVYRRARLLCEFAESLDSFFPVLWGSWVFHVVRAELQAAKELSSRFFQLATGQENPTIRAAGHFTMGCTLFHLGAFKEARTHFEETLARYEPERYPFLFHSFGPELGVFCRSYLAHVLWILGFPGLASEQGSIALSRARQLAHPFSTALALDYLALLHQFQGDALAARELTRETASICDEYGFRYYLAWTPILRGWALVQDEQPEQGAREIRQGLDAFQSMEARLRRPYYSMLLAQACQRAGSAEEGLRVITEAIALVEKSQESWSQSELHRTRGELLSQSGEWREAEASFQHALSIARLQGAPIFELRAALALSRLWMERMKPAQAITLLRKTCTKFSELAETMDHRQAQCLLHNLVEQEAL